MKMFRAYILIAFAIMLFAGVLPQQVEIRELIGAFSKIAIAGEQRLNCEKHNDCLNSEICNNKTCLDPCPGSCGINALCHMQNHKLECNCPRCYSGDPEVECKRGFLSWLCTF